MCFKDSYYIEWLSSIWNTRWSALSDVKREAEAEA